MSINILFFYILENFYFTSNHKFMSSWISALSVNISRFTSAAYIDVKYQFFIKEILFLYYSGKHNIYNKIWNWYLIVMEIVNIDLSNIDEWKKFNKIESCIQFYSTFTEYVNACVILFTIFLIFMSSRSNAILTHCYDTCLISQTEEEECHQN